MATAASKKTGKAAVPVRKPASARKGSARMPRKASADWSAVLAGVPEHILRAEQHRRIALQAKVRKVPQHILDAEIENRHLDFMRRLKEDTANPQSVVLKF